MHVILIHGYGMSFSSDDFFPIAINVHSNVKRSRVLSLFLKVIYPTSKDLLNNDLLKIMEFKFRITNDGIFRHLRRPILFKCLSVVLSDVCFISSRSDENLWETERRNGQVYDARKHWWSWHVNCTSEFGQLNNISIPL